MAIADYGNDSNCSASHNHIWLPKAIYLLLLKPAKQESSLFLPPSKQPRTWPFASCIAVGP
jgi:hypothetical protein